MSELGVYLPGRSLLHRLPAAVKLLGLVTGAVVSVFLRDPVAVGAALALVLLLYAVARIPARRLWAQVRPLVVLLVLLAAVQVVVAGWRTSVVVVGTLLALVLLAGLVSLTTRTTDLVDVVVAGCRPLRPLGVDAERVGLLLALGIRSVPVVIGLAREVRDAQVARGLGASPRAFAVPLVVRSLRHADRLADALVARGVAD
ncbi:MAG TPA: energy-coupling factor transporter transmembrane protein EcfT [Acidimicrobiales bacterium]